MRRFTTLSSDVELDEEAGTLTRTIRATGLTTTYTDAFAVLDPRPRHAYKGMLKIGGKRADRKEAETWNLPYATEVET